ncbi:MAG: hypothetical protein AB2556_00015, partial [Candidatus Thiodiazotropha sp.]
LDKHISDRKYQHAQGVWEAFGCQSLGDFCDLYCRTDVLLLADEVPEGLSEELRPDPAHYYTSPGLSWDALLKTMEWSSSCSPTTTSTYSSRRVSAEASCGLKALRPSPLDEGHDPGKPTSYILYLDANNLYGCAMSQPLPGLPG